MNNALSLGSIMLPSGVFVLISTVAVASLAAAWLAWRRPRLRKPIRHAALAAGIAGLAAALYLNAPTRSADTLPDLVAYTLDDVQPLSLQAFAGKPLVVNVWASWCPPCVREMPALQDAQVEHPDVQVVFLNQREPASVINRFLDDHKLTITNVLRDPAGEAARVFLYRGLPTTLFFDASGRLVASHPGELSRTALQHYLDRIKTPAR